MQEGGGKRIDTPGNGPILVLPKHVNIYTEAPQSEYLILSLSLSLSLSFTESHVGLEKLETSFYNYFRNDGIRIIAPTF
jgi:hypothetical protein